MTGVRRYLDLCVQRIASEFRTQDLSIFHDFHPSPYGGGNQFLLALRAELRHRGYRIETNTISRTTRACLFNSFNFDFDRLRRFRRQGCRMVHRVDGPVSAYRGCDREQDERIWGINQELAAATVFQSEYSLKTHLEMGLRFRAPIVVRNTCDPAIFNPSGRVAFDRARKIRLLSASWSDNANKGALMYKRIEERLDWNRFEYAFVGRSPVVFDRIRMLPPMDSCSLAALMRQHDVFITASLNDPCSNVVIEAMACGLPPVSVNSGGHAEIAGDAGLGFSSAEEVPALLDRMVNEYEARQAAIAVPSLADVASRYLAVLLPESEGPA